MGTRPPSEDAAPRRVVVATDLPVWEGDSGAHQRILALLRALRAGGFDTALFHPAMVSAADRAALASAAPGVALRVPAPAWLALRAARRWSTSLTGRRSTPFRPPLTWERRAAFQRLCRALRPHAVIVEYARLGYLVEGLSPAPLRVVDTHDVISLRARRMAESGVAASPGVTETEERDALRAFDVIVAIQSEEAAVLRAMLPGKRVIVAGHALEPVPFRFKSGGPCTLLFVGAGGDHNIAALDRFLTRIWPMVWRALAGAVRLDVAGRVGDAFRDRAPEGVRILGLAPDLAPVYAAADIVINPCFVGSGLKIKNIEALAHGKPLVTTPLGAEGINLGDPPVFRGCADDAAFADAVLALAADEGARRALAGAAHAHAAAFLRPELVFAELLAVLREPRTD